MDRYEFYDKINSYKKNDELKHYGTIGQKWGVRHWQNADGTFNAAGKERYFGTKGNKKEKADEKTGKPSKNKWSMNDLFKKAGYNYDNSDDETRELFEMEINDIRNSYKNGNDINKLSKKFGYDKNFIQDVVNSDPNQKIGSFKVNFKKSSDNSDLGTRTFYTRDEYNKTLNKLDNKYGDDYYPTMSNDEYRKMYEETPMYGQNKKIGGLFNKTPEEKAEKKAAKEAKKINDELEEEYLYDRRHWDEVSNAYINESEFSPLFENIRKSNNEKLSKDYDKVNDIFKDYLKNEDEYVIRAAIARSIIDEETTLDNIGRMSRWYLMDDGDQGYANSSDLYARYEKNINDKEIERLYQSLHNNKDMYNENVKYLKDNNKVLSKVNDMLLLELCKENEDEHNTARKNKAYWRLYDAADGSSHNGDLEKDAYNKAKKITEKLHKSCSGNDGWYYLNQAIENLDLNSIELRNMTQADWDKINAEINKLKK